jgi:demethylmenaquinone methyltransferase/2-methoxy-6-polyprenyl-1,4-benzoquinol methylase
MGYALRHVEDLRALFGEFHRVLKPDGRALVLEISRPKSRLLRAAMGLYLGRVLPFFTRWRVGREEPARLLEYYWATIDQCVAPARIEEALTGVGFAGVRRTSWGGLLNDFLGVRK